jgi:hypothetical protein
MTGLLSRSLRVLCLLLLALALASIGALILSDAAHGLRFTGMHSRIGALALVLIGSSYAILQFAAGRLRGGLAKRVVLGLAFVLWGGEQLLPVGWWTTAMDTAVIAIFVVDLGLIILQETGRQGAAQVVERPRQPGHS